jgi:hypothetical protein
MESFSRELALDECDAASMPTTPMCAIEDRSRYRRYVCCVMPGSSVKSAVNNDVTTGSQVRSGSRGATKLRRGMGR